jgi:uncharacterized membrane protein YkvA (DUF1232 family)
VAAHPDPTAGTGREIVPGVVVSGDRVTFEPGAGRLGPGARDRDDSTAVELARFLGDSARLLWRLARDRRVPWTAKVVACGAVAYVVSPLDLIPDAVPGVGRVDDLYLLARALRHLAGAAGYDLLHELWTGSEDGFALLLVLAGIDR